MKTLIFLPTQGPHLPRSGPADQFDWHVQCRLAASLQRNTEDSVIYVPSAFHQTGSPSELDYYGAELRSLGVPESALILASHGLDTVEQCELATALATETGAQLIAVTCHVQRHRIRYLLRHTTVQHIIARGTPSRWLHFTHLVLTLAFPVLDLLGLRPWWKARLHHRRLAGKQ